MEGVLSVELWVDDPASINVMSCYSFFDAFLDHIGSLMDIYNYDLNFSIFLSFFLLISVCLITHKIVLARLMVSSFHAVSIAKTRAQ